MYYPFAKYFLNFFDIIKKKKVLNFIKKEYPDVVAEKRK